MDVHFMHTKVVVIPIEHISEEERAGFIKPKITTNNGPKTQ